jgi:amino-acid N-acetyltransferase
MTAVVRSAKTSDVKKIRAIIDTYAVERKLLSKETVTLF